MFRVWKQGAAKDVKLVNFAVVTEPSCSSFDRLIQEHLIGSSDSSEMRLDISVRFNNFIEERVVPIPQELAEYYNRKTSTPGKKFVPDWDINEDESIIADNPEAGGTLAYQLCKGSQLHADRPFDSLVAPAARTLHKFHELKDSLVELVDMYTHYQHCCLKHERLLQDKDEQLKIKDGQLAAITTQHEEASSSLKKATKEMEVMWLQLEELEPVHRVLEETKGSWKRNDSGAPSLKRK